MFVEDEDVLLNGEDGLFYFGTVARVYFCILFVL